MSKLHENSFNVGLMHCIPKNHLGNETFSIVTTNNDLIFHDPVFKTKKCPIFCNFLKSKFPASREYLANNAMKLLVVFLA